jgi:serine/threonine protein kinase
MNPQLIGQLIGNRYRLIRPISEGGYGQVFEAVDTQLGHEVVAVKLLRPPPPDMGPEYYQQLQQRFLDEARVSALLGEHPNIVQVRSYGLYQNQPYLVMEYLNAKPYTGQGLDSVLAQEGPLPPERVVNLALQICSALHHAHNFHMDLGKHSIRGVIHRDIKPSNIFVQKGPDGKERVKILDFGISKLMGEASRRLTQTGYFLGTMVYASPEQMRGEKLDARSDIYSLGVVLYELLTGKLPFEPDTDTLQGWYHVHNFQQPRPLRDHPLPHPIPEALEKVVLRCLEKDPALRPATMEELAQELQAVYSPRQEETPPRRIPAGFGGQGTPQAPSSSEVDEKKLQQAVHWIEAGEYKKAVRLLSELIQKTPNDARYYLYRGLAHQRQGHWGLAQMDYQGVLRLEPGNPFAEQGLREVEQQVGSDHRPTLFPTATPWRGRRLAWAWLLANGAAAGGGYLGLAALAPLLVPFGSLQGAVVGAGLGLMTGLLQWAVLRRQVSWRWVAATLLATAVGWLATDLLAPQVEGVIPVLDPNDPWIQRILPAMASPLRGLLVGLGVGGLQGILLARQGKVAWAWLLAAGAEGGGAALLMGLLLASSAGNPWLLLLAGLLASTRPLSALVLLYWCRRE